MPLLLLIMRDPLTLGSRLRTELFAVRVDGSSYSKLYIACSDFLVCVSETVTKFQPSGAVGIWRGGMRMPFRRARTKKAPNKALRA